MLRLALRTSLGVVAAIVAMVLIAFWGLLFTLALDAYGPTPLRTLVFCVGRGAIKTEAEAFDAAFSAAKKRNDKLFDGLSISSKADLLTKFPNCCHTYHPNVGHRYPDNFYWMVDMDLPSPCTGKKVTVSVLLSCVGHENFASSHEDACHGS